MAHALQRLGRLQAAESAYVGELANPAALRCATAGLRKLGRLDASCAYADALARDGERQAAHAAYLKVLASDPSSRCAGNGLKATVAEGGTSIWTRAGNFATDAGAAIAAVVVALLVLALAALLWLQVQTRTPRLRDLWPANRLRRPVLIVQSLTDDATDNKLGSAVAGLIRGRVTWKTDRFGLNLVSGQAGVATAFSGLGDVSSEAKAAVAVITFLTALLPRRRFELRGELQPAGAEGVGISLELGLNGGAEALVCFWAASFQVSGAEAPTAYQHLAVACSAWVDIWMTKALDDTGLLTRDPQSWAFFRSGVDAQRLGDTNRAQVMYEQALASDGSNVGAMANLGIICRRRGRYEDAEEYFNRALPPTEDTDRAPRLPPRDNPDWYRIKYQFAALYTNWATDTEPGELRSARAQRARTEASELARTTLEVLTALSGARHRQGSSHSYAQNTLKPFLEGTIEPSVLALLAGTVSPLPARPAPVPEPGPDRAEILAGLSADPIDAWQLIAYVERGSSRPPATQFNLACFYTRTGELGLASQRLLRAVRETQLQDRRSMVDVALGDPVLRPLLRKRPGIRAKLYELLDGPPPLQNAPELARHFDRQDRTVRHLEAQGWTVAWELDTSGVDLAASRESQRLLVRLLGLDPAGDGVNSMFGIVEWFRARHPDATEVFGLMVLAPESDCLPDELAAARERRIQLMRDAGTRFEYL